MGDPGGDRAAVPDRRRLGLRGQADPRISLVQGVGLFAAGGHPSSDS